MDVRDRGDSAVTGRYSCRWRAGTKPRDRIGAAADIDQLQQRITMLDQELVTTRGQLDDAEELEAARAAKRELTRALKQRE